jgi:hypothetical protein
MRPQFGWVVWLNVKLGSVQLAQFVVTACAYTEVEASKLAQSALERTCRRVFFFITPSLAHNNNFS